MKRLSHIFILVFLLLTSGNALLAQFPKGSLFSHSKVQPGLRLDGLRGIGVQFDLDLSTRIAAHDSNGYSFALTAWLFTADGKPVGALPDDVLHFNPDGRFRDSTILRAGDGQVRLEQETMFLPYHALALDPGPQQLELRLRLRNLKTGILMDESMPIPLKFDMPALRLFRVQLDALEVYETDQHGDTWDPVIFSPRELYPDIEWLVRRGTERLHTSDRGKNSLKYTVDPDKDQSRVFALAEGDSIYLVVHDHDLLGSSDIIGQQGIAIWTMADEGGKAFKRNFGRTKDFAATLYAMPLPKLRIRDLQVEEGYRHNGISGCLVRFKYDNGTPPNGMQVRLLPEFTHVGKRIPPRSAQVLSGPAVADAAQVLDLLRPAGDVAVFFPWYALGEGYADALQLKAALRIDNRDFGLGSYSLPLSQTQGPPMDLGFGQWKIVPDSLGHVKGMRFSCEYYLAQGYFDALPKASFYLRPSFVGPHGPLAVEAMRVMYPPNVALDHGRLPISADRDSSSLDMFVPYHILGQLDSSAQPFSVGYAGLMRLGESEYPIGARSINTDIHLPDLLDVTLQVKEVSVKRERWMINGPNLQWRIMIGDHEAYASRVVYNQKNAHWKSNEAAPLHLHPEDWVRIEIMHMTHENTPRFLASWQGRVSDLPTGGGKNGSIKVQGIKHILFRIADTED
jgi:hypothetical protein